MQISIIAALSLNNGIGYKGQLLWRIPDDLARFKQLTIGKPVVMGRKTFESIGRPLPGRINIVLTRDPRWSHPAPEVVAARSFEDAVALAQQKEAAELWVAGGEVVYREALPWANRLYLTLINEVRPADTFFPAEWQDLFPTCVEQEKKRWNKTSYRFTVYER